MRSQAISNRHRRHMPFARAEDWFTISTHFGEKNPYCHSLIQFQVRKYIHSEYWRVAVHHYWPKALFRAYYTY